MSYSTLYEQWSANLRSKGVKLPAQNTITGCALLCLFENIGDYVDIDEIRSYIEDKGFQLRGGDPVQVRHLSTQKGFYITTHGKSNYCLNNLDEPHPSFIPEKRKCKLTNEEWKGLLKGYDYMCVNCGSEQDKPMRWNKTEITKLQKGHMNPQKALTTDNCIPQCSFCNQQYKDKVVFNKRGFVIKMLVS